MAIGITLTYGTRVVRLERFSGGGANRSYVEAASLSFASTGSAIMSGSNRNVRKLWTVSSLVEKADAFALDELYKEWDSTRATGAVATVTLRDEVTVLNPASPTILATVFSQPVTIEVGENGSPLYRVSFSLTEV